MRGAHKLLALALFVWHAAAASPWRQIGILDNDQPNPPPLSLLVLLEEPYDARSTLETAWHAVSNPSEPDYSAYWDDERLRNVVGNPAAVKAATSWLSSHGATGLTVSPHEDSLTASNVSVWAAARLLGSQEITVWEHEETLQRVVRPSMLCPDSKLPVGIAAIFGAAPPDLLVRQQPARRKVTAVSRADGDGEGLSISLVDNGPASVSFSALKVHMGQRAVTGRVVVSVHGTNAVVSDESFEYNSTNNCVSDAQAEFQCQVTLSELALHKANCSFELLDWTVSSKLSDGTVLSVTPPVPFVANSAIKPALVRQWYKIPEAAVEWHPEAAQAVFEQWGSNGRSNGGFSETDLSIFRKNTGTPSAANSSVRIIGANNESAVDTESTGDVQQILSVAPFAPTTYWNIDGARGDGGFLQWAFEVIIRGCTYCTVQYCNVQ